jgi:hypothetical protein
MPKVLIVGIALALVGCSSQTAPTTQPVKKSPIVHPLRTPRSLEKLKSAPLYTFNEAEVDVYLRYLAKAEPDPINRVVHLARKNIGQPYDIYLLGEAPYEMYDPDPMYCLNKSDCVTFVEHMYAMGLSDNWTSFFNLLQRLRYKDGKVGMLTRNHESVADWEPNNAWLFDDISTSIGDAKQSVPLHLVWRPSKFFAQFGIGQDMKDVVRDSTYIPRQNIPNILKDLRQGDLIHIVRGNEKVQSVTHFGMMTSGSKGEVNFLNSRSPRVIEETLMDYLTHNKKVMGIKVLRPRPNPQQLVAANVK